MNNSNSGGAAGTGGALVNSGGTVGNTGGVVNNTGGVVPVTGGVAPITGGMMNATGGAMTGTGGVMTNTGNTPVMLPTAQGSCPTLTNGANSITLNSTAMSWKLWVGTKAATPTGPIVIYWHGTGTNSDEVTEAIGMAGVNEVVSLGGVVASADVTSNTGTNTGDVDYADQIIACAMQQLNIDTRHIHTSGYSAGALQVGYMYGARSGYLASAVVYSGGDSGLGAFGGGGGTTLVDPTNLAPVIGAHGSTSGDFLAGSTTSWEQTLRTSGTFVIDCDDGGSHVDITRLINLGPSAWQFFKDHPFKVGMPDPYAGGIPASFPASSNCSIVP